MKQTYKEAVKYGIIGVLGFGIDLVLFFLFRDVFGIPYWISHIMSSSLAILNNFVLNRHFTFHTTDKAIQRGVSFFVIAGIGLAISSTLLPWGVRIYNVYLHEFIHIESQATVETISKFVATGCVAVLQFFANKYLTFKKSKA